MNEGKSLDRRRFERILFDAPCELHSGDSVWPSHVLDISMKGVLVKRPAGWEDPLNQPFEVTIHLNDRDTGIVMAVELRHVEDDHLGFKCRYIDIESASHLKRLVELNLGDPALLDRELRYLDGA
ncbi:PilZ domain-containing protein [Marinobacter fonticola]|uniref:PilZ domain-containing protein n=1 Tax=Marinobacter fonticola TaxID=2603215 RepID=UPI0011E6980E|nr:PilZ domain-containing protein [Marinobacter fonticola]